MQNLKSPQEQRRNTDMYVDKEGKTTEEIKFRKDMHNSHQVPKGPDISKITNSNKYTVSIKNKGCSICHSVIVIFKKHMK